MIEYLGKSVKVIVDRELGSKHPEYGHIYTVNYGYIEGTIAGDGEEIDAYILGVYEPVESYEGIVIGLIRRHDDVEDKLVVSSKLNDYDKKQISALVEFQERFFDFEVITLDYLRSSIRNTVRALIYKKDKVLLLHETFEGNDYYFLPGGGVEFRESIEDAARREVREELDAEIVSLRPMKSLDNIFEVDGMKCHEIVHLFEVKLDNLDCYIDGKDMNADIFPAKFRWVSREDIVAEGLTLYPVSLLHEL